MLYLVNDRNRTAIAIGNGHKTAELDLLAAFSTLHEMAWSPHVIHSQLEVVHTINDAEYRPYFGVDGAVRDKLAALIYVTGCRRVVNYSDVDEERGDVEGEFFGIPLDDGLVVDVGQYVVVGIFGHQRISIGMRVHDITIGAVRHNKVIFKNFPNRARDEQRLKIKRVLDLMFYPETQMEFPDAYHLMQMGAKMRSTHWVSRRNYIGIEDGNVMYYETSTDTGRIHRFDDNHLMFADITGKWVLGDFE
jgi:hypothetical protein